MTDSQRQIRSNVRNFLMVATRDELQRELTISIERGDTFRAECVRELITEIGPESDPTEPESAESVPVGLDDMLDAYVETALWSSTDDDGEPLDREYSADDIAPDTLDAMRRDVASFWDECHDDIESADVATVDYDRYERAAHDFWLTRNRHGAGFWDGDWSEPQSSRLTDASHAFGSFDLYIGDDGKIHGA